MAKSNFYLAAKRSEYRNNYLPFDYYDFWITAKENENLRCQNKIRDYVHTPFDWDEDQEYYLEKDDKFHYSNQATQTSERPRHERKSRQKADQDKENHEVHFSDQKQHTHHHQHNHQRQNRANHFDMNENRQPQSRPQSQQRTRSKRNETEPDVDTESSEHLSDTEMVNDRKKPPKSTKSTGIQIHIPESRSFNIAKPRKVQSGFAQRSKSNADKIRKEKFDSKSITNMSVQTPPAWTLRDYQKSKPSKNLNRSASARVSDELKPKRAPFANYGWATRTKDLSNKPTHNALANKILAAHNDKDAIIELTLQKIKKNANLLANEYSAIESNAAEFHRVGRSESRVWNSEYGEKYPDYSRSPSRNEIYMNKNPYRLNKSSLISNYPPLRRGPKSATRKVYYVE